MQIIFLGTGTSQGVPVIGCKCQACTSNDSKDKRLRSAILIKTGKHQYVIDPGPDFRQQMLREEVDTLDAIIITHPHKDHIGGMDDVRAYNFLQKKPMDVYIKKEFIKAVQKEFFYAFEKVRYPGVPQINLLPLDNEPFVVHETKFIPIKVMHSKMEIFGFRIGDFTYITDACKISPLEKEKAKGTKILVINAVREKKHYAHFNLEEALQFIEEIAPKKAYLTHISHMMGPVSKVHKKLPSNVEFAYDGLALDIEDNSSC